MIPLDITGETIHSKRKRRWVSRISHGDSEVGLNLDVREHHEHRHIDTGSLLAEEGLGLNIEVAGEIFGCDIEGRDALILLDIAIDTHHATDILISTREGNLKLVVACDSVNVAVRLYTGKTGLLAAMDSRGTSVIKDDTEHREVA